MGQYYYNRLRNNRIKGISLGLVFILMNSSTIYFYYLTAGKDNQSIFIAVIISSIAIGLLYILGLNTFGQVIEKTHAGQIATFYKVGTQKLKIKVLGQFVSTDLTQDPKKYYCLTVKTTNGDDFILEKFPTLHEANERLQELRMTIG